MSHPVLVLGESGSGKSYSMRNLDPASTFLINVIGKELPFRGVQKHYVKMSANTGNMLVSDSYEKINGCLEYISTKRPEIKVLVIDDSQYLIVDEFMRGHSNKGKGDAIFSFYNDIGDHFWKLVWDSRLLRQDLIVFFLHHTETNDIGKVKAKTIGKMLDEKVNIPGMFSICLHVVATSDGNFFETKNTGMTPAKAPPEMFESDRIPNDLNIVVESINKYYKGE